MYTPPHAAPPSLCTEASFLALKDDIAVHGVYEPIWLYQGKILDGHNRYRASQDLHLECPTREYTGDDPLGFVISLNLTRRHLNESQRAMVAENLANLKLGDNRGAHRPAEGSANLPTLPEPPTPHTSQAAAAKLLNVSTRSVTAAHEVRTEAQPELIAVVEKGKIAVSKAATLAKEPAAVQRQVAQKVVSGEAKSATQEKRGMTWWWDKPWRSGLPLQGCAIIPVTDDLHRDQRLPVKRVPIDPRVFQASSASIVSIQVALLITWGDFPSVGL